MDFQDLETQLSDRAVTAQIFADFSSWVVWLYASDEPDLGIFIGTGQTLQEAFEAAFVKWDFK
jgi:hypothetical protein